MFLTLLRLQHPLDLSLRLAEGVGGGVKKMRTAQE